MTDVAGVSDKAVRSASRAARSRWLGRVGRFGLVAKGASYALVAGLALLLAGGFGGRATEREGALEAVAGTHLGRLIVVALAAGFVAYAVWRLAQALFDRGGEGADAPGIAKRIGYFARAVVYGSLALSALTLLDGAGDDSTQTEDARQRTAEAFSWPGGRWLVGAVGVGFLVAAGFNAYRAVTQKFEEKWYVDDLGERTKSVVSGMSSTGLLARFVVFGLIGLFVVKSAYEYDPREAIGLDGALRKLADGPYGEALLAVVAVGLLCYAVFCFVEARYRRV